MNLSVLIRNHNVYFHIRTNAIAILLFTVLSALFADDKDFTNKKLATTEPLPSIFFCIDHSESMYFRNSVDTMGYRFKVTETLIDTINSFSPNTEIGISLFNRFSYFNINDDSIFVKSDNIHDTSLGGFIPLLDLNKEIYGRLGYTILKKYIKSSVTHDTTGLHIDPNTGDTTWMFYKFVEPVYKSSWHKNGATHINTTMDAAKKAVQKSSNNRENHFVIFISDGIATFPYNDSLTEYIKGIGMPTTFTIYLHKNHADTVPQSLLKMTNNIKNNGYSSKNEKSDIWSVRNTSYEALFQFIMENIIDFIYQNVSINYNHNDANYKSTIKDSKVAVNKIHHQYYLTLHESFIDGKLELFTLAGRKLYENHIAHEALNFALPKNLNSSILIVKVSCQNKRYYTQRLLLP